MTVKGFVVTLAEDTREDDAEATVNAIRQLKGVSSVEPVPVDYHADFVSRNRTLMKVQDGLSHLLKELWAQK